MEDKATAPAAETETSTTLVRASEQYQELSDRGSRIPFLDGLRGIAILLVIFHHAYNRNHEGVIGWPLFFLHRIGWIGVDVFFVISGFLITLISVQNVDKPHFLPNFFIRRTLRIFPVYYATLLVLLVFGTFLVHHVHALADNPELQGLDRLWVNFLYLTTYSVFLKGLNWAPYSITWSLSVEEWFYLIFPFLLLAFRKRPARALWLLVAVAIATRVGIAFAGGEAAARAYYFMPARLDSIAIGGLAAVAVASGRFAQHFGKLLLPGLLVTFAMFGLYYAPETAVNPREQPLLLVAGYSVFSAGIAMVILGLLPAGTGRAVKAVLNMRWLAHLGKVSYGVYLFHIFIVKILQVGPVQKKLAALVHDPSLRGLLVVFLAFTIALAIATVSYNLFEYPVMKKGRKWMRGTKPAAPAGG